MRGGYSFFRACTLDEGFEELKGLQRALGLRALGPRVWGSGLEFSKGLGCEAL